MSIYKNIRQLCKTRGTTVSKIEKKLGYNKVIYNWDKSTPSVDKVAAVADVLGVTIDEILGRSAPELSKLEQGILELFQQLNDDGQAAAIAMLQGLAVQPGYIKSNRDRKMEK